MCRVSTRRVVTGLSLGFKWSVLDPCYGDTPQAQSLLSTTEQVHHSFIEIKLAGLAEVLLEILF